MVHFVYDEFLLYISCFLFCVYTFLWKSELLLPLKRCILFFIFLTLPFKNKVFVSFTSIANVNCRISEYGAKIWSFQRLDLTNN